MPILWIGGISEPVKTRPLERAGDRITVPGTSKVLKVEDDHALTPLERKYIHARDQYQEALHAVRRREPALTVEQIMTGQVHTLSEDALLPDAWSLLLQYRIHHLPVLDEREKLVGILSDRDLMKAMPVPGRAGLMGERRGADGRVADLMTRKVLTATPDTGIREVARTMIEQGIHCLPIVTKRGSLEGILTSSDILRCVVNQAPLDLWT